MKNVKILITAFLACMLWSAVSFAQVELKVNKALSAEDQKQVEEILKSFDSSTYALSTKSTAKTIQMGNARALSTVKQSNTRVAVKPGSAASTNTNINIFSQLKASTNTNINLFRASTNTNINIFKEGAYNSKQLSQMDKLYSILAKYQ